MASLRAIAEALDRAEKRIIVRARKAFKPIRETIIDDVLNKRFDFYDVQGVAEAFKIGMLSAYLFGRTSVLGDIRKSISSKFLAEDLDEAWARIIKLIVQTDRSILTRLANKKVEPYKYFFRPSQEALKFLDGYTVQLANVIQQDLLKQITLWVRETIEQGMSEKQAIQYLKRKMTSFSEKRIKMIARTEATRAFNIGILEESRTADVVVGYKFDAVLDKNTTEICRARDGKFIPKSETELLIQNTPPLHVNCRSRLVPLTQYDELPKKTMPVEWKPNEIAKQRDYDIATLRRLLQSEVPSTANI